AVLEMLELQSGRAPLEGESNNNNNNNNSNSNSNSNNNLRQSQSRQSEVGLISAVCQSFPSPDAGAALQPAAAASVSAAADRAQQPRLTGETTNNDNNNNNRETTNNNNNNNNNSTTNTDTGQTDARSWRKELALAANDAALWQEACRRCAEAAAASEPGGLGRVATEAASEDWRKQGCWGEDALAAWSQLRSRLCAALLLGSDGPPAPQRGASAADSADSQQPDRAKRARTVLFGGA
ncbi:unnamed protein product, partial [Polarella glacialis]